MSIACLVVDDSLDSPGVVSEGIESCESKTNISNLPDDIISEIFSRVNPTCLGKVSIVCTRWNRLAHDVSLRNRIVRECVVQWAISMAQTENDHICVTDSKLHTENTLCMGNPGLLKTYNLDMAVYRVTDGSKGIPFYIRLYSDGSRKEYIEFCVPKVDGSFDSTVFKFDILGNKFGFGEFTYGKAVFVANCVFLYSELALLKFDLTTKQITSYNNFEHIKGVSVVGDNEIIILRTDMVSDHSPSKVFFLDPQKNQVTSKFNIPFNFPYYPSGLFLGLGNFILINKFSIIDYENNSNSFNVFEVIGSQLKWHNDLTCDPSKPIADEFIERLSYLAFTPPRMRVKNATSGVGVQRQSR